MITVGKEGRCVFEAGQRVPLWPGGLWCLALAPPLTRSGPCDGAQTVWSAWVGSSLCSCVFTWASRQVTGHCPRHCWPPCLWASASGQEDGPCLFKTALLRMRCGGRGDTFQPWVPAHW